MANEKDPGIRASIGKHIRRRLVSGLLVLIPVAITLFILNFLFSFLTAFVRPVLKPWLDEMPEYLLALIALVVAVLLIYVVGVVATHIVGRRLIHFGEKLVMKVPMVRSIYSASKQVVDTFSSSTKAAFKAVVLVEFPHPGSLAVGFITGTMKGPDGRELYRVFVATTPNPTSGFLVILPEEKVTFTDIPIEDGIKMIVSGGMLSPESYRVQPAPPLMNDSANPATSVRTGD